MAESFEAMGLNAKLLRGIHGYGMKTPSDLQQRAIPIIARALMRDPQRVGSTQDTASAFERVKHFYISVEKEEWKRDTVADLYETASIAIAIIFCTTRAKAESLTKNLASRGMTVLTLHGDLKHDQCDAAISGFRSGSSPILVTTDGYRINGEQVSLVINYDLPSEKEGYFKRLDRAGVSPGKRVVINLVTSGDNQMANAIEEFYKIKIQEMPMNVADLI